MAKDKKNMNSIVNQKNDKLKWFFTFIIFLFISIIVKEIAVSNSIFITFFKNLLGNNESIPYLYNLASLGVGVMILIIAFIISILLSKTLNGIVDDLFELISYRVTNKDERVLDDFQATDQEWF